MVEIGPTPDQIRMLEELGRDPAQFMEIPRDIITLRLRGYLMDRARRNAEKDHQAR